MKTFYTIKTLILSSVFVLATFVLSAKTDTIRNSSFTFSPNAITINFGDSVFFQLGAIHNAVEVSQATWDANGTTALPGFSLNLGGGLVTGLSVGVHYFVCVPHASLGMKGMITVSPALGINYFNISSNDFNVYPNPTYGTFTVEYNGASTQNENVTAIEIFNLSGAKIYSQPIQNEQTLIDLSNMPTGTYIVRINDNDRIYSKKLVKR
jgi:plastocyanin